MNQPLKQALREKFETIELDAGQIRSLQDRSGVDERHAPRGFASRIATVAAAVMISALSAWLGWTWHDARTTAQLMSDITAEVVENHLKQKPLDVESSSLPDVLGFFDRLDFQLLQSPRIVSGAGAKLLGGRYCSVQGISAAQLRVRNQDGSISTWYEALLPPGQMDRIPDGLAGEPPVRRVSRGIRVSIWKESGVLFVEARPAEPIL